MKKILRIIWKSLDIVAVIVASPAAIYSLPFSLLMAYGILSNLLVPQNIIAGLKPSVVIILFTGFGATYGLFSLVIAALMPKNKICARKSVDVVIIFGLISGIIVAVYYLKDLVPFGTSSTHFMGVDFVWSGSYLVISAVVHIVQLLLTKYKDN